MAISAHGDTQIRAARENNLSRLKQRDKRLSTCFAFPLSNSLDTLPREKRKGEKRREEKRRERTPLSLAMQIEEPYDTLAAHSSARFTSVSSSNEPSSTQRFKYFHKSWCTFVSRREFPHGTHIHSCFRRPCFSRTRPPFSFFFFLFLLLSLY